MKKTKKNKVNKIITIIFVTLSVFIIFLTRWLLNSFGNINMESIIFTINVPLKGTTNESIIKFLVDVLLMTTITSFIINFILLKKYNSEITLKYKTKKRSKELRIYPLNNLNLKVFIILLFLFSLIYIDVKLEIRIYLWNQINESKLIEERFVDTEKTPISFNKKKRNLIYIYLESMESSYTDKRHGGIEEKDLIPELRSLAENNISFSNTNKLGGAVDVPGTSWTTGAMVAQTTGMPLKLSIEGNSLGEYKKFLPGIYTLGDILNDNGYNQEVMFGSDADFSGKRDYFKTHGNYKIFDVNTAIEKGKMKAEDRVWWGYEDSKLFKWSKEEIIALSKKDKPFNYTMLTVDTHFEDGWLSDVCDTKYNDQYSNVIACSSKQVYEFVNWIKEQEFYDNTTIIISGDHITMDVDFFENIDPNYQRTVYNVIINSAVKTSNTKNRLYSTIDMFPTTIAALGGKIKGDKLGIGTNLFSNKKTLLEEYGLEKYSEELRKKSTFYNNKILYGKDK